jgi:hypothetical protein
LIILIILSKEHKLWSSSLCSFLKLSATSSLLDPNILLSAAVCIYSEIKCKYAGASKEVGVEVNPEKTKYTLLSCHQNAGPNLDIKKANGIMKM